MLQMLGDITFFVKNTDVNSQKLLSDVGLHLIFKIYLFLPLHSPNNLGNRLKVFVVFVSNLIDLWLNRLSILAIGEKKDSNLRIL